MAYHNRLKAERKRRICSKIIDMSQKSTVLYPTRGRRRHLCLNRVHYKCGSVRRMLCSPPPARLDMSDPQQAGVRLADTIAACPDRLPRVEKHGWSVCGCRGQLASVGVSGVIDVL